MHHTKWYKAKGGGGDFEVSSCAVVSRNRFVISKYLAAFFTIWVTVTHACTELCLIIAHILKCNGLLASCWPWANTEWSGGDVWSVIRSLWVSILQAFWCVCVCERHVWGYPPMRQLPPYVLFLFHLWVSDTVLAHHGVLYLNLQSERATWGGAETLFSRVHGYFGSLSWNSALHAVTGAAISFPEQWGLNAEYEQTIRHVSFPARTQWQRCLPCFSCTSVLPDCKLHAHGSLTVRKNIYKIIAEVWWTPSWSFSCNGVSSSVLFFLYHGSLTTYEQHVIHFILLIVFIDVCETS